MPSTWMSPSTETPMRALILLAPFALIACDESDPYAPAGHAADVDIEVPDAEDDDAETPTPPAYDGFIEDGQQAGPELLQDGTYAMRVLDTSGESCWASVVPKAALQITVDGTPSMAQLMGFVNLRAQSTERAWGIGSRGGEIIDDCVLTEAVYVDAELHSDRHFNARFHLSVAVSGDGCEDLKEPIATCSQTWDAELYRLAVDGSDWQ